MRAKRFVRAAKGAAAFAIIVLRIASAAAQPAPSMPSTVGPATDRPTLSLKDAVASAQTRGFDMLLAAAQVRAGEGDLRAAGQAPNPSINVGPSRRVDCWSGTCTSKWGAFVTLSDEGLIEGAITRKRRLREDVAMRALEASRSGRSDVERVIAAQTKIQYVQTAAAQAKLDLAREVAAFLEQNVAVNRIRHPRVINEGQLARVEQEALRANQDVDRAVRALREEQIELAMLLGFPGSAPAFVVDRSVLDYRAIDALAGLDNGALLRVALESRPDRKRALALAAQSDAAVMLRERERVPDVALLLQFQQLGAGDNAAQPPTLSIGVGLQLPLFYQKQGEIARAEAERQSAILMRDRLDVRIASELESALNGLVTARRIVERYESRLLERAKRALDITRVQFGAGSATLTDLLDAQRSWVEVTSGYYAELASYWIAVFQLEQAIGKELVR